MGAMLVIVGMVVLAGLAWAIWTLLDGKGINPDRYHHIRFRGGIR